MNMRWSAAYLCLRLGIILLAGLSVLSEESVIAAETEAETVREQTGTEAAAEANSEEEDSGQEPAETFAKETVSGKTEKQEDSQTEPDTEDSGEEGKEPKGYYSLLIKDIHAEIPDEGRIYDGTEKISLAYTEEIETAGETDGEEIPDYTLTCSSHLDGCDAGERRVVYSFSLETPWPDHVMLKEDQEYPELTVEIKKAVLSILISDGTKKYMDPADTEHITFLSDPAVTVSGFVKDAEGNEMIPEGFSAPEVTVDTDVLKQNSPAFVWEKKEGEKHPKQAVRTYERALVLKKTPDGMISGNPGGNYEFCCDPEDERYTPGAVTVEEGEIQSGEDYTVQGDEGAYLIAEDGTFIVREGTRLYAEPYRGAGYNRGAVSEGLSGEGIFTFRLQKTDRSGKVTAESQEESIRYICDPEAGSDGLSVGGASGSGPVMYSAASAQVMLSCLEDDISGIRSIRYRIRRTELTGPSMEMISAAGTLEGMAKGDWQVPGPSGSILLSDEGICQVEYEITDGVGNSRRITSPYIVIDRTAPAIVIQGVTDKSAISGDTAVTVTCSDAALRPGSLNAVMTAKSGSAVPPMKVIENSAQEETISFAAFPEEVQADGVYTLRVAAEDLAGNESVRTISFSVNRFGSVYRLEKQTGNQLRAYYHRSPFAVCFIERNTDRVSGAKVLLRRGTTMKELTPGDGLLSVTESGDRGNMRYRYSICADAFREDGRYEVILMTTDAAGNSSDSAAQDLPVRFAIDRTPPQCLITGACTGEKYEEETHTVIAEARDNLGLYKAEVYIDTVLYRTLDEAALSESEGIIRLSFPEKENWQTLQIHVSDLAGNEYWTPELEFCVSRKKGLPDESLRRPRLSARQIASAKGRIRSWYTKIRAFFQSTETNHTEEEDVRLLVRNSHVLSPADVPERCGSQTTVRELQRRQIKGLLAAAGGILLIPAVYLVLRRRRMSSPGRRRR